MTSTQAIEGDYLEVQQFNLIFDVKGIHHPKERTICYIRFFPDYNGHRIRNGLRYSKIYDLKERHSFLKKNYPQFLFYSKDWNLELQAVKNSEIKKVYNPRVYFKNLSKKNNLLPTEKLSVDLCDTFLSNSSLSDGSIGITGSQMVGLNQKTSDIDLVIYGTDNSINFQDDLLEIFNLQKNVNKYSKNQYRNHYQFRAGGSGISLKDFLFSERRKLHQGTFNDIDFFIRYIKSSKDWKGSFEDYKYENCGRITCKAEIIDDSDAIFTPCSYRIKILKIKKYELSNIDHVYSNLNEINSYRGRFCEHAKNGEQVYVEGKLEKVIYRDSDIYYRILLGNQKQDKMIVLSS